MREEQDIGLDQALVRPIASARRRVAAVSLSLRGIGDIEVSLDARTAEGREGDRLTLPGDVMGERRDGCILHHTRKAFHCRPMERSTLLPVADAIARCLL